MIRAVAMTKRQIKRALDILKSQDDGSIIMPKNQDDESYGYEEKAV
jgi:hypothetical protein